LFTVRLFIPLPYSCIRTIEKFRKTLCLRGLGMYFPCVLGPNQELNSVMPAQAGIQGFQIILDSRFRGNDPPNPCENLYNV